MESLLGKKILFFNHIKCFYYFSAKKSKKMQKFLIFFKIIVDTKYACVIYSQSPSSNTTA